MKNLSQAFVWSLLFFCLASCKVENQKLYDITAFGAVSNSDIINTETIQAAIDKCAENGGGTVVVPSGTFLTRAIFFKQNVNLEIKEGGVLKGTTNIADYKLVQTRWEGEEQIWLSALINVFDISGFCLSGKGVIDGSGDVWFSNRKGRYGDIKTTNDGIKKELPSHVGPIRVGLPTLGENLDLSGLKINVEEGEPVIQRNITGV